MHRTPRFLLAVLVLAALLGGVPAPAGGEELPPGFTDGRPVGEEPGTPEPGTPEPAPPASADGGAEAAAATQRYFGQGAYDAVRAAVAATSRPCSITNDGLTALVLSPVFKESSAATTPTTAPSPMTLSRYDEWTGTIGTGNNRDANYGLYAFRNPNTAYPRAYWHPGIGIWQYDSAGLGAPLTTVEAMDVRAVASDVARIMSTRYCAATGSDQNRRYEAWRDWGFPCTLCQGFFTEMMGTSPHFADLNRVAGIGPLGGTKLHTCVLAGVAGTLPCWYVEPRVGVIQGATAWATLSPGGGSGPTVAPAPLSHPFYVVDRGATEERHWMRVDTGYSIDIRAVRTIGKNARPRSNQAGSGLTWTSSSSLCDLTTSRGSCAPVPPSGMLSAATPAGPGYRPLALDADGDGRGDVLWYRPGPGADYLWTGAGGGSFASHPTRVTSTYDDVLAGDVDGDGDDDVLWYARSSGAAFVWLSDGDGTFTSRSINPGANRRPFLLDSNGDGDDEVFWYGPGSVPDAQWDWVGSGFVASSRSVAGAYLPLVGDFDANGREDVFWYAPGPRADSVWLHSSNGSIVTKSRNVVGSYFPILGDFDGDGADDVFWYAPGTAGDSLWFGAPAAAFTSHSYAVNGSYSPVVSDLEGTGRDSLIWYAPGTGVDSQWRWSASRVVSTVGLFLPGQHRAILGGYSTGGADGIVWYEPTLNTDVTWYR